MMRMMIGASLALAMALGSAAMSADVIAAERFTFARPPAPDSTVDPANNRLEIVIDRWSTASERDLVLSAMAEGGPKNVLSALYQSPRAGTLKWPGGLDYTIHYAYRQARPDGGADVTLVLDRPLWMWWNPSIGSTEYPFSVVQMRLDKNGAGEGRVSLNTALERHPAAGIAIANPAQAPVVLTDVRRDGDRS